MFVVDASVWVSRYLPPDEFPQASSEWLLSVISQDQRIVAPALLLPELTGPISRAASEFEARRALSEVSRILALQLVPIGGSLAKVAGRLAAQFRLRGADAIYVALAMDLNLPLVTWDGERIERGSESIIVRTPGQLLQGSGE